MAASESKSDTTPPKSSSNTNKKSSPKSESTKTGNPDQNGKSSNSKSPMYNSASSYNCDSTGFGLAASKSEYSDLQTKGVSSIYTDPSKPGYNDSIKSAYSDQMKSVYSDPSKSAYLSDSAKMNSDLYKTHYPFGIDSTGKQQSYMNFGPMNMAYLEAAKSAGYYIDPSATRSMYHPGFDPKTSTYHSDGSPTGIGSAGVADYSLSKSEPGYLSRVTGKPDYMDIMSSGEPYYMSAEQHHYQQQQQQQQQQDHQQEQQRNDYNSMALHHPHQHQQHQLAPVSESVKSEYASSLKNGHDSGLSSDGSTRGAEYLLPGQIKAEYPPNSHHHHLSQPQQHQQTQKQQQQVQMHPHSSPQPYSTSSDVSAQSSSSMSLPSNVNPHHQQQQQQHTLMTSSSYALSTHPVPATAHVSGTGDDGVTSSYRANGSEGYPRSNSANSATLRGVSDGTAPTALHSVPVAS